MNQSLRFFNSGDQCVKEFKLVNVTSRLAVAVFFYQVASLIASNLTALI